MPELLLAWILLQAPVPPAPDIDAAAAAVAGRIVCYCGTCSHQTVHDCTCGTAAGARAEIRARLEAGDSPAEVIAYYTGRYGEQILIAPTGRGFNLVAWVTPFVALFAAAAILLMVLKRWSSATRAAAAAPGAAPIDPAERARLERELRDGDA